jgi:hypothetical protein
MLLSWMSYLLANRTTLSEAEITHGPKNMKFQAEKDYRPPLSPEKEKTED